MSNSNSLRNRRPGRVQEGLARRLLGSGEATPYILGDLREEYAQICQEDGHRSARLWYWKQTLNVGGRLAATRAVRSGEEMVSNLILDLRFALRSLSRRPGFTAGIVLTLGLGVAGSTTMFSLVDAVLLEELPYEDPQRLVSVWKTVPEWRGEEGNDYLWDRMPFLWVEAQAVKEEARSLDEVAFFRTRSGAFRASGSQALQRISLGMSSGNLLRVLGVRPYLGRYFSEEEAFPHVAEPAQVVVLGYEFWSRMFGADPDVVGTVHSFWGSQREVIGVMPPGFRIPSDGQSAFSHRGGVDPGVRDVWVPLDEGPDNEILARLAPGASVEAARVEANHLLNSVRPLINLRSFGLDGVDAFARVETRKRAVTRGFTGPLVLLWGASGLLLAVACVNIAGLLMGAAVDRRREVQIRSALGAGPGRIRRLLLTECVVLGLMGSAVGILLTWISMDALLAVAPPLPRSNEIGVDGAVLAFALACGLGAGTIFGLAPAWKSTRISLTSRGQTADRESRATHRGILTAQVALTTLLLIGGGLFTRSFTNLLAVDPGFDPDGIVVGDVILPGVDDQAGFERVLGELMQSVEALPGVASATAALRVPFGGSLGNDYFSFFRNGEMVEVTSASQRRVLPNYHSLMGIDMVEGRAFLESSGSGEVGEMIVSRALAESIWPGQSPVGEVVNHYGKDLTIVGVVGDVRKKALGSDPEPVFYLSLMDSPLMEFTLVARVATEDGPTVASLEQGVHFVNPDITVSNVRTMGSLMVASESDDRFRTVLVLLFAGMATLISTVGVFAVVARAVATRSAEIAIRKALGAVDVELLGRFVKENLRMGLTGVGVGAVLAYASSGLVSHFLFGIPGDDPWTYSVVALLLLGVCTLAAYLPARRITRIKPREVLASE